LLLFAHAYDQVFFTPLTPYFPSEYPVLWETVRKQYSLDVECGVNRFVFYKPQPKTIFPLAEVPDIFPFEFLYASPNFSKRGVFDNLEPFFLPTTEKFDSSVLQKACAQVFSILSKKVCLSHCCPVGAALSEFKMKSSPGFPYNSVYDTKGHVLAYDFRTVHDNAMMYLDGTSPAVPIWYVFPKKELLPVAKVNKGGVRTIQCAPIDFLLACQIAFTEQNRSFIEAGLFQVGEVLEYGGFTAWCKKRSLFDKFLSVDGAKFDRSICSLLMQIVCEFRARLHSDPDVVRRLYDGIINAHLVDGFGSLYFKEHGNPSGSLNTTIDNCIVTMVVVAYSVIRAGFDFTEWWLVNQTDIFGDDLNLNMRGEYVISFEELKQNAAELGITYDLSVDSESIISQVFFGKTIAWSSEFDCFVGLPNFDKLFAQLSYLHVHGAERTQAILNGLYASLWVHKPTRVRFREFVSRLSDVRHYQFALPNDLFMYNLVLGGWVGL